MKKLLVICTLVGMLLLSACSTNGVTVCTDINGNTIKANHEDGEITSFVMTETDDISAYDEKTIEFMTATFDAMPEATYSIDDDILTIEMTLEGDAIHAMIPGAILDLEEFIADAEANGATCE